MTVSSIQLTWFELHHLIEMIRPRIEGKVIDKIQIPARSDQERGFLLGEYQFKLGGFKPSKGDNSTSYLRLGLIPQKPFLYLSERIRAPAAKTGTWSPFGQKLVKALEGKRIQSLRALPRERSFLLETSGAALLVQMIPTRVDAFLLDEWEFPIRGRIVNTKTTNVEPGKDWMDFPNGDRAPDFGSVREHLRTALSDPEVWAQNVEAYLTQGEESSELRQARQELAKKHKQALRLEKQLKAELARVQSEPDGTALGLLLKAHMHDLPPLREDKTGRFYELPDLITGELVRVPVKDDRQSGLQADLLFKQGKRRLAHLEEVQSRLSQINVSQFARQLEMIDRALAGESVPEEAITAVLNEINPSRSRTGSTPPRDAKKKKSGLANWNGKIFVSHGFQILVGRNKKENLQLTLRIARGNDTWLHLRGRPSAHAVILSEKGKSVPLEVLLDASYLLIHYSGGKDWGKTEVDYTTRKHVKSIKGSDQVSYSQNKTLLVEINRERLQTLLAINPSVGFEK